MRTDGPAEQTMIHQAEATETASRPGGCSFRLPAVVGIAAALGFLAALALVLAGFGTVGLRSGLVIGAASIAGVTTNMLLHLPRPEGQAMRPVLATVTVGRDQDQRAA